jgi:hypothetical protein
MADYSHHHTYRVARAPRGSSARRFGGVLAGALVLMLAALAWIWTQQSTVDPPLPRAEAAASSPAAPPRAAKPASIPPQEATPANAAIAAAGDTRSVR